LDPPAPSVALGDRGSRRRGDARASRGSGGMDLPRGTCRLAPQPQQRARPMARGAPGGPAGAVLAL